MKTIFSLFLVFFTISFAFSQNSLEKLISQSQKANETEKVSLYNQISAQYLEKQDLPNMRIYANKALEIAQKLKNLDEQAAALTFLAESYSKIFCMVTEKDSMQALTEKYKVSEQEIMEWNALNGNILFIDQSILINKMGIGSENYLKAENYLTQALAIRKTQGTEKEIWALRKLADFYLQQQNFEKSAEFYEKCLEIREKEGDSKKIVWATQNLLRWSMIAKSEKMSLYAEKMKKLRLQNKDTVGEFADLNNFIVFHKNEKRLSFLKQFVELAEKYKDFARIRIGNELIIAHYLDISRKMLAEKQNAKAEQYVQELLAWLDKHQTPFDTYWKTRYVLNDKSWVLKQISRQYTNVKNYDLAILYLQKCAETNKDSIYQFISVRRDLAILYDSAGKIGEAIGLHLENLVLFEQQKLDKTYHPQVDAVNFVNNLVYRTKKNPLKEVSQILDKWLAEKQNMVSKNALANVANALSFLYQEQKNYAKSVEKKLFFVQNSATDVSAVEWNNLAFLYQLNKNFAEAEKYFTKVLNENEDSDLILEQHWKLVNLFVDKKDLAKAEFWANKALKKYENHENIVENRVMYARQLAYATMFWAGRSSFFFKAIDYANRFNTELSYLEDKNNLINEINVLNEILFTFNEKSFDKDFIIHVAAENENLQELLNMYQIDLECFKKWNYIPYEYYSVQNGIRLRVCKSESWKKMDLQNQVVYHEVYYEETLESIAEQYGVSVAQIVKLNKLDQETEEVSIYEGQRLWIKGKKMCTCE